MKSKYRWLHGIYVVDAFWNLTNLRKITHVF